MEVILDELEEIRKIEDRRCALISAGDIDEFAKMLSDDYIHVHITGRVDDAGAALDSFRNSPRQCWRGELDVRVIGDVAIAVGPQTNRMTRDGVPQQDRTLIATTVLHKRAGQWLIVHFHACARP